MDEGTDRLRVTASSGTAGGWGSRIYRTDSSGSVLLNYLRNFMKQSKDRTLVPTNTGCTLIVIDLTPDLESEAA